MKRNEPKDYDLCRKGNHRAREEKASQKINVVPQRGKEASLKLRDDEHERPTVIVIGYLAYTLTHHVRIGN